MHFFVANFSTACYTFPVMEVILNTEIEILGVTVNVFNQVFSLIATVLMIACYYVSRKKYMWLLSIALLVCVIEYLILKQYSVCISYSVSIARNVVQIIYDNKNKKNNSTQNPHTSYSHNSIIMYKYLFTLYCTSYRQDMQHRYTQSSCQKSRSSV